MALLVEVMTLGQSSLVQLGSFFSFYSRTRIQLLLVIWATCSGCLCYTHSLQLPSFFDSSMVLQHGEPINFWGTADPGVPVAVEYFGALFNSTADKRGRWDIQLPAHPPSLIATKIEITAGQEQLSLVDVVVGNVLLCSGQSNVRVVVHIFCIHLCACLHVHAPMQC